MIPAVDIALGAMKNIDSPEIMGLLRFFPTLERLEKFIDGELYLNPPDFYRRAEQAGVGDDLDACIAYYSSKKHAHPPRIRIDGENIDLSTVLTVLAYKDEDFYDSHLQCWFILHKPSSDEDLNFLQADLIRVKKEFGNYYALLPIENLCPYIKNILSASKTSLRADIITYSENKLDGSMFVKQHHYSYQREYRIAIGKIEKGNKIPLRLDVGNLSNLMHTNPFIKLNIDNDEIMLLAPYWHDRETYKQA